MTLFNADDYGITPAQTEHILECRRRGRLTGVSAMPNSPYLEKAMDALAREPGLLAAVHLNLTEGLCLSDPRDVPLLADADGRFRCSFERLLFLSLGPSRRALSRQMEAEFTRQIRRVAPLLAGRGLRLDGHQHIQMIPRWPGPPAAPWRPWGSGRSICAGPASPWGRICATPACGRSSGR